MKICPKCNKEYDDTWKVCLKCGTQLSAKDIGEEFRKIFERLDKIEKHIGIAATPSEKSAAIGVEKSENPQEKPQVEQARPKTEERKDIESTIGLVWLNRIGIIAIFLGVAFFLKYAFDNRWIGELGRVIIGLIAGFGLLAGSEVARRKDYTVISQGLHGGGIGVLYLSIFAAFGFYNLIGVFPALIFMSAVTLYCGFWSTRTDWLSSAVIGVLGGFLTPFLLGPDKIAPSILFSYVVLLDLGILFISIYKKWGVLNIASFFLTQAVYYNWHMDHYKQDQWLFAALFMTAFYGIFCILSIFRNLMHRERSDKVDIVLVLLNGVAYFLGLYMILKPFAGSLPGLLPITLGCLYIAYSYSALRRCSEDRPIILSYVALAVIFVTITIPVQMRSNWIAISWAIEAIVLIWMGFKLGLKDIRRAGLVIGAVSLIKAMLFDYSYAAGEYAKNVFIFNERMFTHLAVVLIIFLTALLYKRNKSELTGGEKSAAAFLVILANFVLVVQFSVEANTYFAHLTQLKVMSEPEVVMGKVTNTRLLFNVEYSKLFSARELVLSLLWVAYAFVIVAAGMYRKFRALRVMGLVLFGAAIFKIFLFDLSQLDKIYRIISFMTLGVVLIVASLFYQKYKDVIRDFALKGS